MTRSQLLFLTLLVTGVSVVLRGAPVLVQAGLLLLQLVLLGLCVRSWLRGKVPS